jgi:hypothetical protein
MPTAKMPAALCSMAMATALLFSSASLEAQTVPLHDGLISYWPLNDGAGATAADMGPAGTVADTGELNESPAWINGIFGAGLQFTGTEHVLVRNSADMNIGTSAVTVSAWIKLDTLPAGLPGSFGSIFDSQDDNYVLYLDKANNELRFKAVDANGTSTSGIHPGIPASMLDTTSWHHVMGVYDGTQGGLRIYYDGNLVDVSSIHTTVGTVRPGQVSGIGGQPTMAEPHTPSNFFQGGIADVAVWNRPLTAADAQYMYNAGVGNAVGAANALIDQTPEAVKPAVEPVIYYNMNGNLANHGSGGAALDGVFHDAPGGTGPVYKPSESGMALDLSSNPQATNSTTGTAPNIEDTGKYVSVDYHLPDQGTIAVRFSSEFSYDFQAVWANSANANAWEAWVYGTQRLSARGNQSAANANLDFMLPFAGGIEDTNHIAFSWERTGTTMKAYLYVDGVLREISTETWQEPGSTFFLGGGPGNHLSRGVFDELRIYDVRLSDAEILFLARVPEPASIGMVALLLAGVGGAWMRRPRRK